MDDVVGLPAHDDDEAVAWLHCPVIDDGDSDTAPLPPEYCAGLLPGYSGLPAVPAAVGIERPSSHGAATLTVPSETAAKLPQPSAGGAGEGVMNFTFFSRPLQRPLAPAAGASNHVESTAVQTVAHRLRSTPLFSDQRMAWLQPPPKAPRATAGALPPAPPAPPAPDDGHRAEPAATITQQRCQPEVGAHVSAAAAAVTTSSVCSGNGDRSQLPKRSSYQPAECSVSPDEEDFDDETGVMRRSAAARGTKRGRTAEVHNLSERRRRDRINEKMRALQELIPNCNKIDKASMLEEAIEYLKTLQLQVQMMSMGTGLCMPPMLLPATMQHLQMAPPMVHFPHHLGLGLGLGMGAPAFDMVPIPRLAGGAQFPCQPMPMPPGAMFGVPGQGMPSPATFHHMAMASGAPTEHMEAAARGGGNQPAPVVPQDDHQKLQHLKQA